MFGIPEFKNYDVKLLLQIRTLLGAGGFGLIHLFYYFSLVLGAPDNGQLWVNFMLLRCFYHSR